MTRKQRRLTLIGAAGAVLAIAAGLVLYALSDRIVRWHQPAGTEVGAHRGDTPGLGEGYPQIVSVRWEQSFQNRHASDGFVP